MFSSATALRILCCITSWLARTVASFCRTVSGRERCASSRSTARCGGQAEHVPPGLVTLGMVTVEKACRGSGVQHQPEFPAEIVGSCIPVFMPWPLILEQTWAAAVDTVANAPDGIAQHATRGPGIEYRLKVLQGWRSRRRMISLGRAEIGNDGSASSRQREDGEHALGSEEGELFISRQLSVDLDVCRDEIGGIVVTGERDAECVTNGTVGAVAGDEIGDVGRLLPAAGTLKQRVRHVVPPPCRDAPDIRRPCAPSGSVAVARRRERPSPARQRSGI
jgi:hypothetical protein